MFARWHRRLGPRYPRMALGAVLRFENVALILGVAFLGLYVPISPADVALLVAAAIVAQEAYIALARRRLSPELEAIEHFQRRRSDPAAAMKAWKAAASLPFEILSLAWRAWFPAAASFGWCLVAVWVLSLEPWTIPLLYVAAMVTLIQGNALGFLIMERALQPVLDDVADGLRDEADAEARSPRLGRRLLPAMVALSVMTAVGAVGLLEDGQPGLDDLALAVAVALVVACAVSLPLAALLTASVVSPIGRLEDGTERVAAGDLATRVPVVASDETGTLTRAFNRMVAGLQERERLREAFGIFVDPDLAERVAAEGTDLRGEELELSILFMDIRGFTTFSESAEARDVVSRLNELYELVVPAILRHGGHANKFIGDGLLAVFGAPERHEDHTERAVAAALDLVSEVEEHFAGELRVGVGVNSGAAVVGTIGGGGRLDFTVIGDTVNTAARVESATRDTGDDILITGEVHGRIAGQERWVEREPMALKGKSKPVSLWAPVTSSDSNDKS